MNPIIFNSTPPFNSENGNFEKKNTLTMSQFILNQQAVEGSSTEGIDWKVLNPSSIQSDAKVIVREYLSSHEDGSCDNFLRSEIFVPYILQLKSLFFKQHTNIDGLITNLASDSSLKLTLEKLLNHMRSSQEVYRIETNRNYYTIFMKLLRECQQGLDEYPKKDSNSFKVVQNVIDNFVQDFMMSVNFKKEGLHFLHQKGLSANLSTVDSEEILDKLIQAYDELNGPNHSSGLFPGLYDPFFNGNLSHTNYTLHTQTGKEIKVIRCPNFVSDRTNENSSEREFPIGEQIEMMLNAYKRQGKKHFTVNMMQRPPANCNEAKRSSATEALEKRYPGTLNVISIDRNSEFYHQEQFLENDADLFKLYLFNHLFNSNYFYWSQDLNEIEWKNEVEKILNQVHQEFFSSAKTLYKDQRKAFIELTYTTIINHLTEKFNPDCANFTCKSCIDRGVITQVLFYLYNRIKLKKSPLNNEDFNHLLFMTFLPAMLSSNRTPQKCYMDNLFQTMRVLLSHQPQENEQNFIQDISIPLEKNLEHNYESEEERRIDISELNIDEMIKWRLDKFLSRNIHIPLLTSEEQRKIETIDPKIELAQRALIEEDIEKQAIDLGDKKSDMIDAVTKHYFITKQYYAPAVMHWMDSLLQQASKEERKLVFLARDGIVLHEAAQTLLEKYGKSGRYGNLKKEDLQIAWLPRNSAKDVASKEGLLQRYFKQLGIEKKDKILMVDTGCTGSMKKNLKPLLSNDTDWQFAFSRNPQIRGFWDNCDFSIPSLSFLNNIPKTREDAWANDPKTANTWIEDAHQGNLISAQTIEEENGVIYAKPSFKLVDQKPVMQRNSITKPFDVLKYSISNWGYQSIIDFVKNSDIEAVEDNYQEIKRNLNDALTRIQKGELALETTREEHTHIISLGERVFSSGIYRQFHKQILLTHEQLKASIEEDPNHPLKQLFHLIESSPEQDYKSMRQWHQSFVHTLRENLEKVDSISQQKAVQYLESLAYEIFTSTNVLNAIEKEFDKEVENQNQTEEILKKLKEHPTVFGNPMEDGSFDPLLQGSLPTAVFTHKSSQTKVLKIESPLINSATDSKVSPEFLAFLRESPSHLYINLMNRSDRSKKYQSDCIERLEKEPKYRDRLTVVTLDTESEFYWQAGEYEKNQEYPIEYFKQELMNQMFNPHINSGFYWSGKLDLNKWQNECLLILDQIHENYFSRYEKLNAEERRDYIELVYVGIVHSLMDLLEPKTCSVSDSSSIDKGANMLAEIFAKESNKKWDVLRFSPALFMENRIPKDYIIRRSSKAIERLLNPSNKEIYIQKMIKDTLGFISIDERNQIYEKVKLYIYQKHPEIFSNDYAFSENRLEKTVEEAIFTYIQSKDTYAPIATSIANQLLKEASKEGKKLVFLARDGIIIGKAAKILLNKYPQRYPNVEESDITTAFFSRKVIANSQLNDKGRQMIREYVEQLGLQPRDRCLFVDIGFSGSMVEPIRELLKDLDIEFRFVYFTREEDGPKKTKGFLKHYPCKNLNGVHPLNPEAIHWLEDSHQGVVKSPKKLVQTETGITVDTIAENKTYKKEPKNYLMRKFGMKAIKDYARTNDPESINTTDEEYAFNYFLSSFKAQNLKYFISHPEIVDSIN